jgi:hypothetical protein
MDGFGCSHLAMVVDFDLDFDFDFDMNWNLVGLVVVVAQIEIEIDFDRNYLNFPRRFPHDVYGIERNWIWIVVAVVVVVVGYLQFVRTIPSLRH